MTNNTADNKKQLANVDTAMVWLRDAQAWMDMAERLDSESKQEQKDDPTNHHKRNVAHACIGLVFELAYKSLLVAEFKIPEETHSVEKLHKKLEVETQRIVDEWVKEAGWEGSDNLLKFLDKYMVPPDIKYQLDNPWEKEKRDPGFTLTGMRTIPELAKILYQLVDLGEQNLAEARNITPNQLGPQDALNAILGIIREIEEKSANGNYIFRGEPECYPKISSTLYRECQHIAHVGMERIQRQILTQAQEHDINRLGPSRSQRAYFLWSGGYNPFEYTERQFEILAEIQHWGGETNLIDFTTDYHVALFFACDSYYDEDGRVIIQDRDPIRNIIWEPTEPVHRVEAQKGIFVQPPTGFIQPDKVICIPKTLKVPILKYLMQQDPPISTKTIYNDLHGFIRMQNRYRSAFVKFYIALDYEEQGSTAETLQGRHDAYKKAVDHYRATIDLMPNLVAAHINCGRAHAMLEDFDSAIYRFNEAADWKPDEKMTYNNLGNAYGNKGDLDLAIKNFDIAIKLNSDDAFAYRGRANVNFIKGKLDVAIKDYNKAIELNSDNFASYVALGTIYDLKGQFDLAIDNFDKAIELIENHVESSEPYSNLAMDQITSSGKTVTRKSAYSTTYKKRGDALCRKNNLDLAIKDYTKAIDLKSDYAEAYYRRGIAWLHLGEQEKARADLTAARSMGVGLPADLASVLL